MDKHTIFQQIKKNTEQEASNPRTKDNLPTNTQSGAGSYNFHSAQGKRNIEIQATATKYAGRKLFKGNNCLSTSWYKLLSNTSTHFQFQL